MQIEARNYDRRSTETLSDRTPHSPLEVLAQRRPPGQRQDHAADEDRRLGQGGGEAGLHGGPHEEDRNESGDGEDGEQQAGPAPEKKESHRGGRGGAQESQTEPCFDQIGGGQRSGGLPVQVASQLRGQQRLRQDPRHRGAEGKHPFGDERGAEQPGRRHRRGSHHRLAARLMPGGLEDGSSRKPRWPISPQRRRRPMKSKKAFTLNSDSSWRKPRFSQIEYQVSRARSSQPG